MLIAAKVVDEDNGSLVMGDADAGTVVEIRRTAADTKVVRVVYVLRNRVMLISPGVDSRRNWDKYVR